MTRAAGTLEAGQTFAERFRVERPLAEGGMGQLYVVTNVATGHRCALKLLGAEGCFDEEIRSRFLAEARNTPSDASDHIVKVHDAGVADGRPWIAMELLDGATLQERVTRHGALSWTEARDLFAQLCHGLAAAHGRSVVHRDLKPENVFLQVAKSARGGEFVKVLDFGVAKALDPRLARGTASIAIGTQGWWAPEQVFGGTISAATDVWALGLLAYWCLTERPFFDAGMPQSTMMKSATARAAEQGVASRIPPGFDAWFEHCVAWEPTQRFRDAAAAWRALDAVLKRATEGVAPTMMGAPVMATPPYAPRSTLRPMEVSQRTERTPTPRAKGLSQSALVAAGALAFTTTLGGGWWLARELSSDAVAPPSTATDAPPQTQPASPPQATPSRNDLGRPLGERSDLQAFVSAWDQALHATIARQGTVSQFYAERTRLQGSKGLPRTRMGVDAYWANVFHGTIEFAWSQATWLDEPLDLTREVHSACKLMTDADPGVIRIRVPAVSNAPQNGIETIDHIRCEDIHGVYLLRMRRVQGTLQICHDAWSLDEAICTSCPNARECQSRP
ncbi:MAG: serine/threonine-protein kinase [Polyangiales bacterium]